MEIRKPILDQISTLKNLPTLPHILLKLIQACNRTKGGLEEVARIIEKDPSLSSRILRLVNSAYYGLPRKIKSMQNAVTLLGTNAIKNVAISASIYETFKVNGNSTLNLKLYWWHSLRCGVIAKLISEKINYNNPDEAFLAGLLHDIGRLVLWVNFKKEYKGLLDMYGKRPDLLLAGEIRLGVTHCEVGAWLLNKWKLPSLMADAVFYHHESLERIKDSFPLVKVIYLANMLSQFPAEEQHRDPDSAKEILGLSENDIKTICSKADDELEEVAKSLDIEVEPPGHPSEPISDHDAEKHLELIREVQDSSILLGTLLNLIEANSEEKILHVIYQGLNILFDTQEVIIFLYDQEKKGLEAVAPNNNESSLEGLFVPMTMKKSLLISCLFEDRPLDSFSVKAKDLPVILDEQLIRFAGKEGILCHPMVAQGNHVGVIVFALDQNELYHLAGHLNVLKMFCRQAALTLNSFRAKQEQLRVIQSERMVASSAVARKVIHEVNNPLSIIKNYLKILGMKLSQHNIAQDEIRIINEEIDRVSKIISQLDDASGKKISQLDPINLNSLISDIVSLTKDPLLKDRKIMIHTDLDASLPYIKADKDALKQVFINLIKNAAEAMKEGGNLHIKTRYISSDLDKHSLSFMRDKNDYAEVIVQDDGPGIPEHMKKQIFEPFVSSKGEGHRGLGLSIVHSIVRDLNGNISCETSKETGTIFKITLPINPRKTD